MKHLLKFKIFEKEAYTGKTNTYRLRNIHMEDGELVGNCRKCGKLLNVTDQTHPVDCAKELPDGVKQETYWLKGIHFNENEELVGNCKKCDQIVDVTDKEHYTNCFK